MYVCMYVCRHVYTHKVSEAANWMRPGWGGVHACVFVYGLFIYSCVHVCMYVCMYMLKMSKAAD